MSEEFDLEKQDQDMPEKGSIILEERLGYTLSVERKDLLKAASGLKEAGFDLFQFVAGVDYPDSIKLTYRIFSSRRKNQIAVFLKTEVPKDDPSVDSLVPIWPAANWHERETYDLLGVNFIGHPNLSRIFMPEDWVGHPLRKDYTDDRIIVMDDGKKEKPAAALKEKPAVKAEKAEPAVETKPEDAAATKTKEGTETSNVTSAETAGIAGEAPAQPEAPATESESTGEPAQAQQQDAADTKVDS